MAFFEWGDPKGAKDDDDGFDAPESVVGDLNFRGVPVVPRFDPAQRPYRTLWAVVVGLAIWFGEGAKAEADFIDALDGRHRQGMTLHAVRTADAIEVDIEVEGR